jgi:hypothetical protein
LLRRQVALYPRPWIGADEFMSTNYHSHAVGDSPRKRCPICDKPVYSAGGVHPQCAVKHNESVILPPLPEPDGSLPAVPPASDPSK